MSKPPLRFILIAAVALLWNLAGLGAVVAGRLLSAADVAALPAHQQALHAARPSWAIAASVVPVVGGTLGCVSLLLRKRWSTALFYASLLGVVVQDIGLLLVMGAAESGNSASPVLQGLLLAMAIGLVALSRRAVARSWLS